MARSEPATWPPGMSPAGASFSARRSQTHAVPQTWFSSRHTRASFRPEPDPADRAASQLIIDLGADAVIASGAHEFQGIEVRNGRPIVHNAGSLLFNFPELDKSLVFLLTLGPAGVERIRSVPLILEHDWTRTRPRPRATRSSRPSTPVRAPSERRSSGAASTWRHHPDRPSGAAANLARLDPGPAPGPVLEPPAACAVDNVPANAARAAQTVGPLRLLGARVDRDRVAGPALIWLETYWSVDAPISTDLLDQSTGVTGARRAVGRCARAM